VTIAPLWRAFAQRHAAFNQHWAVREVVAQLGRLLTFLQQTIKLAPHHEAMLIALQRPKHLVVIRFAVGEMNGLLRRRKHLRGRPHLAFPALVLSPSPFLDSTPRLETQHA